MMLAHASSDNADPLLPQKKNAAPRQLGECILGRLSIIQGAGWSRLSRITMSDEHNAPRLAHTILTCLVVYGNGHRHSYYKYYHKQNNKRKGDGKNQY